MMTEFDKTFPHATQLQLTRTFRCPASLCDTSSTFIQANPKQIRKVVRTTNTYEGPVISAIAFATPEDALGRLRKQLAALAEELRSGRLDIDGGRPVKVLLLGRYNQDKPAHLKEWQGEFSDRLSIDFRTVHAAKGLEADYVMLLNVCEGMMGFPSQMADDPVLQIAMPPPDPYPMAEERRLFYVALTRARRQVRIFSSVSAPSRFLVELAKAAALDIKVDGGKTLTPCPKCRQAVLKTLTGKYGPFEVCPVCNHKRSLAETGVDPTGRVRLKQPMRQESACPTCRGERWWCAAAVLPNRSWPARDTCQTTAPLATAPLRSDVDDQADTAV